MVDSTKKIARNIRKLGWQTEFTGGGHIKCTRPDAAHAVIASMTPSARNTWRKLLAQFERALKGKNPA